MSIRPRIESPSVESFLTRASIAVLKVCLDSEIEQVVTTKVEASRDPISLGGLNRPPFRGRRGSRT